MLLCAFSRSVFSAIATTVRLKPDTTYDQVRLKPDTTYDQVRLKPDTTYDQVRLKPDTTYDQVRLSRTRLRPSRQTRGQEHRGDHALRIGDAFARDVERRSVVHRRANDRQTERHVHGLPECEELHRNQALIVIAGDDGV